ncbi:hypothetical protein [Sphingomonas sp. SRS2]|uniref:hypothetical protein n=1 Tax=Sphingomonas sp. SRS2 TaxID=133190 RepID=UPI00061842E5|nr:hypothetical protein [Sphingomonas sp. SRS2]KKC26615.1 hypothetical protein WP12_07645 [Sphingomonas sp. SRS2]
MASRSTDIRWLALPLALSACATPPAPPPQQAPPPPPPVAAAPPPLSGDWRDWPLTPGRWRYMPGNMSSSARYGDGAAIQFAISCDPATRRVTIMRAGRTSELAITTSYRTARFPAGHVDENGTAMSAVILNARDAFFDEMVFSRGRIAVVSPGLPSLAIPTWAEPARAIEDCRK